ncbi:MAG: 30S ribosomal protein S9 [Verrucomicrobia bacterium]|nr:30S ribosomal protein S9 [Verrucomicrobiota bacterium]
MSERTNEFWGTGRRKTSVARVRISPGVGKVSINGRTLDDYFTTDQMRNNAVLPLETIDGKARFDLRINVTGGGLNGQSGAVRHGIARALLEFDPNYRPLLKAEGYLTRDPRSKERKKYGQPGARKRFQFSKR